MPKTDGASAKFSNTQSGPVIKHGEEDAGGYEARPCGLGGSHGRLPGGSEVFAL